MTDAFNLLKLLRIVQLNITNLWKSWVAGNCTSPNVTEKEKNTWNVHFSNLTWKKFHRKEGFFPYAKKKVHRNCHVWLQFKPHRYWKYFRIHTNIALPYKCFSFHGIFTFVDFTILSPVLRPTQIFLYNIECFNSFLWFLLCSRKFIGPSFLQDVQFRTGNSWDSWLLTLIFLLDMLWIVTKVVIIDQAQPCNILLHHLFPLTGNAMKSFVY